MGIFIRNVALGMVIICAQASVALAHEVHIAVVDSGFGGFFTAKAIEKASGPLMQEYDISVTVNQYGDTANAPYGAKEPEKIAELGSIMTRHALKEGADKVYIACNTVSTQYEAIIKDVARDYPGRGKDVISIIDASAEKVKQLIDKIFAERDVAHFAMLATAATVKSGAYPQALARLYGGGLETREYRPFLQDSPYRGAKTQSGTRVDIIKTAGKTLYIYQLAPGNWVDLIEKGASADAKQAAVRDDLRHLFDVLPDGAPLDAVGYFSSHFPVFDTQIRAEAARAGRAHAGTQYIAQATLMADAFAADIAKTEAPRLTPLPDKDAKKLAEAARAKIIITGENAKETAELATLFFPEDNVPEVALGKF